VDVEGLFFFLSKLGFHFIQVSREGGAFGADAKTTWKICRRQIPGWRTSANCLEFATGLPPVATAIGVFTTYPTPKIAIVEFEAKEIACIEHGAIQWELGGITRGRSLVMPWSL
jgi:hypothetical protein